MANKVKYNLRNAHYAVQTPGVDGELPTFATPVPFPGSVSLSLDAQGSETPFYADGLVYFMAVSNTGYSGDFEVAMIPDSFRKDVLMEVEDATAKVLSEYSDVNTKNFALLFEFQGDEKAIRHVLYNCKATRPSISGQTNTENIEPQTDTLTISATPLSNYLTKSHTTADTTSTTYDNWYKNVFIPAERGAEA